MTAEGLPWGAGWLINQSKCVCGWTVYSWLSRALSIHNQQPNGRPCPSWPWKLYVNSLYVLFAHNISSQREGQQRQPSHSQCNTFTPDSIPLLDFVEVQLSCSFEGWRLSRFFMKEGPTIYKCSTNIYIFALFFFLSPVGWVFSVIHKPSYR